MHSYSQELLIKLMIGQFPLLWLLKQLFFIQIYMLILDIILCVTVGEREINFQSFITIYDN